MPNDIWMTGATGFVGSHFLYRVLTTSDTQVVAILREKKDEDSRTRLLSTLEQVARSYRTLLDISAVERRLTVLNGDITRERCAVAAHALAAHARGPITFWHMAASLCYEDRQREHIRLHNVDGTRNALALAGELAVARFVYVSTAYTCGRTSGEVREELHTLERPFNNVYEQTKCEAEHEVARWSRARGTHAAIVRPSVVVGPRATYAPGGSDSGLYGFARETTRLKRMLAAAPRAPSMLGDPDAELNLVPVDDMVTAMRALDASDFAGGLVHHLTATSSPRVGKVLSLIGQLCGAGPIDLVPARSEPASPVEQAMDRRAAFYSSYLRAPKTFVRRAGPPITVDDEDVTSFVRGYARERRSEGADAVFTCRAIPAADGDTLLGYEAGVRTRPTVVLCNAYGLDPDIWVPLARALAADAHVLTWQPRATAHHDLAGPEAHAADLRALLDHHGVAQAYVVGYCTGADVALCFAAQQPERVLGVASLSGALNAAGAAETSFQRNMRKLAHGAGRDLAHATLYHRLLFGARRGYGALVEPSDSADKARAQQGDEAMLAAMVSTLDPELLHLTSAPFRDPEALHAYARTMHAHYQHSTRTTLSPLGVPTLFVTGRRDAVAHPDASRVTAARMHDATLIELEAGDHFALYNDPSVAGALCAFIARCEAGRPPRSDEAAA